MILDVTSAKIELEQEWGDLSWLRALCDGLRDHYRSSIVKIVLVCDFLWHAPVPDCLRFRCKFSPPPSRRDESQS